MARRGCAGPNWAFPAQIGPWPCVLTENASFQYLTRRTDALFIPIYILRLRDPITEGSARRMASEMYICIIEH